MKKSFIQRTLTAMVFVTVLLGSILLGPFTILALFSFIVTKGILEYYRIIINFRYRPHLVSGLILGLSLVFTSFFVASQNAPHSLLNINVIAVVAIVIVELYRDTEKPFNNIAHTIFAVLYVAVPFSTINFLLYTKAYNYEYHPGILIALLSIIWASDSGAYIIGSLIGKHKLFPSISPKKTWEGSIGGGIIAIAVSVLIAQFIPEINLLHWIIISILAVIFGTYGDLVESLLKRKVNVKDSGSVLPGHGGILDRFDSLLIAAPVVLLYISIFV